MSFFYPMAAVELRLKKAGLTMSVVGNAVTVNLRGDLLKQPICVTDNEGLHRLLDLVEKERDRCLNEILTDFINDTDVSLNDIDSFSMLHDLTDANVYPSGGRSDGAYGDEKSGWSDAKTRQHEVSILAEGIIGVGTGVEIDPDDLAASESYAGFLNALMHAVDNSIKQGWLVEHGLGASGSRPGI